MVVCRLSAHNHYQGGVPMSKKIKTSRFWYNLKDSVKFYFKLLLWCIWEDRRDGLEDRLETDNRINEKLGMPKVGEDENFLKY